MRHRRAAGARTRVFLCHRFAGCAPRETHVFSSVFRRSVLVSRRAPERPSELPRARAGAILPGMRQSCRGAAVVVTACGTLGAALAVVAALTLPVAAAQNGSVASRRASAKRPPASVAKAAPGITESQAALVHEYCATCHSD